MKKVLLVIGHGYSAAALSRCLVPAGWRVIGTTRDANNLDALAELGVEGRVWPGDDISDALEDASHLLLSVPPNETGDPVLNQLGDIISQKTRLKWIGYLSTTAVYGDHGGGWVDEDTPLTPSTIRGRWRVNAEQAWGGLCDASGSPLHIFRLAGIYGPRRGPFAKVRQGTARRIVKKDQVFGRIHVDDIASVLIASMKRPSSGRVYNICDNEAAPPQDVIAFAARLLGLPIPAAVPFDEADLSEMARSFYSESKRVKNDRIKQDLGISLRYPTYREGLGALINQD